MSWLVEMDDKAQVSFEYLALVAVLILIAAAVLLFSSSLLNLRDGLKTQARAFNNSASRLLGDI